VRLFVAIELPDDTKRELSACAEALQQAGLRDGLRWVRPEGIHITLKFLGEVADARVDEIAAALQEGVSGAGAFELRPEGVGTFGGRRPRVVWVGVGGETSRLAALADRVEQAISPLGFPREQRAFSAHLTLARVREDASPAAREAIAAGGAAFRAPVFTSFRVERVSLMRSTLQRGGAVYDAVSVVEL
jgi:2'-5' RNA ligase